MSGVYVIWCWPTGQHYIGSSINLGDRIAAHFRLLNSQSHHNANLQKSFDDLGRDAFSVGIVEHTEAAVTRDVEQIWLDNLGRSFNASRFVNSTPYQLGFQHTEETKALISRKMKGRPSPMRGRRHSAAIRLRISNGNRGGKRSAESRQKMSAARVGWCPTIEIREKISRTLTGRKPSAATLEKLRCRRHTPEQRKAISEAIKRSWSSGGSRHQTADL